MYQIGIVNIKKITKIYSMELYIVALLVIIALAFFAYKYDMIPFSHSAIQKYSVIGKKGPCGCKK